MDKQELQTSTEHFTEIEKTKEILNKALQEGSQTMYQYINLGNAYSERYENTHEQQDLDNAIASYKGGLVNCSGDTEDEAWLLDALGFALLTKYEHWNGGPDYLEEAMNYRSTALGLCQPDNHNRTRYLNNLGIVLFRRYEMLGEMGDLEKAISYHEQGLDLCLPDHPIRPSHLNNLGLALENRYEQQGEMEDLEKAIGCHEQTLDLRPPGHSLRSNSLNNLGSALFTRYKQLGEMRDLEKALSCHRQTLDLHPSNHPNRSMPLNNLGIVLFRRYEILGEMEDLEKAISCHEEALDLRPFGHPFRSSSLNNLAIAYEQLGTMRDLEKAISYHEQALGLRPYGHPERSHSLENLGNALSARHEKLEEIRDLEKAISCHKQALELRPSGHHLKSNSLLNLGASLIARYKQLQEMEDLDKAMNYQEQAVDLSPPGHPERSQALNNLGYIYYSEYLHFRKDESLNKAIDCYKQAAHATSHLPEMLKGAKDWAHTAHEHNLPSATPAYILAMNLLHQHLALLPSLISQQKLVERSSHLSLDAAAFAIDNDKLEIAVQYLEQGRSILWSRIQGYRQPLEDISKKAPHLAQEFKEVSHMLEHNATSGGVDITLHHSQYRRWTILLEEIRTLDGFSDYLQATPFQALKNACAEGPIIMINISDFRSDAIILVMDSPLVSIPLQDATPQRLKQLVNQLLEATNMSNSSGTTYQILKYLWNTIAQPVVTQLKQLNVPEKSHIWWCPTSYLCALPIHAAGPYQKGLKNLPDLYISSYTPTLTSLIKARSSLYKHKAPLSLLLVSQPDDTIPQVFEESRVINRVRVHVNSFSGSSADKQGVLASLQSHPWVHFACHGHLEAQPFHSWFQLYNKEHLTVLDLAKAQLPNAEFAFLSACHSAAGSIHGTPDESIHLAGALQVSGFKSVVGTLWAMVDDDGPPIADAFYREIFANLSNVNVRDTAMALNTATREMRRKMVPVNRWISFIHLGA